MKLQTSRWVWKKDQLTDPWSDPLAHRFPLKTWKYTGEVFSNICVCWDFALEKIFFSPSGQITDDLMPHRDSQSVHNS